MADKLIAEAIGKLDRQNIAHGRLAGVQVHRAIGIGRLEPSMADQLGAVLGLLDAVDNHLGALAHMCGGGGKTERLGQVHGLLGALELDLLIDLTFHLSGQAALLLRVGKDTRVVKADGVHKVDKVAELVVGLGREADHGRGTDHDAGDTLTQIAKQVLELLARTGATHGLKDACVAVLHGDIDIG